jgi:hypothetical protein
LTPPLHSGSELSVCPVTIVNGDHRMESSCAQLALLHLPTLKAKSSRVSLEGGEETSTDDSDYSVHDAQHYSDEKEPDTKLREAPAMAVVTQSCHSNNPTIDTKNADEAPAENDRQNSGLGGDQNDHHDNSGDNDNGVAGSMDTDQQVARSDVVSHMAAAVVLVGTVTDHPDVSGTGTCSSTTATTTATTTGTTTTRHRTKKAHTCHRQKRNAVVVVRSSVKGARAAYMAQARSIRSGSARLKPIPEATLTRAQRITI